MIEGRGQMNYRIDTHIHTTASDGTLYPNELLDEIKKIGIEIFSITDHDTIGSIDEMKELIKNEDFTFIPGVEISVTYGGKEIHLLTYGNSIGNKNEKLLGILNSNSIIRNKFEDDFMYFVAKKFKFSFNEYATYIRNPKNGGWKAENFLKEKNIISSLPDIFKLIEESKVKMSFRNPKDVIKELKEIGLIVVLAHPPAYYKGELLDIKFLDYFRSLGIDGIECYSPYYKNILDANYYKDYCKKYDMLIMSGSDYHGDFVNTRKLGIPERYISEKSLEKLLKLVN
ncbi:PHP domain-containing protein [Clostridiaceae bacterium HSG29]|nr:PHP domain-containing protein [Clostridiaceae bacterium HSG29]